MKWAGGKRWLADRVVAWAPRLFERYIEPFVGSGAVFFALSPSHARLSDINVRLIEAYQQVRDRQYQVRRYLSWYQQNHGKAFYYAERDIERRGAAARAAQFIYFNRTCWNGLYRVNRDGWFNVPIGTKSAIEFGGEDILAQSRVLKSAEVLVEDFETAIEHTGKGDFLFVDPPYTVNHNFNGFIKYNEVLFSWKDQVRLRDALIRADKRGAKFVLSNAAHHSVSDLYSQFYTRRISRASVISGSSAGRGKMAELIISNYLLDEKSRQVEGGEPESIRQHT